MTHRPTTVGARLRNVLIGGTALGLILSGCAGPGDDRTTLTVFSWERESTMEPVIEAFEAENPDIRIELSHAPPVAEYISTLQNRLLAGTAADVFVMGSENKTSLIEDKQIVDLTDEPYMDVVAPLNKEIRGMDGRVYALSVTSYAAGIVYNVDVLAEHGYTEVPAQWDDFVDMLRDLKSAGVTPYLDSWSEVPIAISASIGASIEASGVTDADIFGGDATFEEVWEQPLERWAELFEEGLLTPDVIGITNDQVVEEFATGRVAMTTTGPWNVNTINDINPDLNWEFAGVPQPDGVPFFSGNASPGWAINVKAAQPEAAQTFLAFLASAEGVEVFQKETQSLSTTSNYEPEIAPVLAPNLLALQEGRVYLPQAAWTRQQNALNVEAVAQLQNLAQGALTAAEVGAALDAKLAQLGG